MRASITSLIVLHLVLGACAEPAEPLQTAPPGSVATAEHAAAVVVTAEPTTAGLPEGLAPESARVDMAPPRFTDSTAITNPFMPVSDLAQAIQLGTEAGEPIRVEITLLPATKTFEWNGQQVTTRIAQYVAHTSGEITEVALDYYAQADEGSVWYFGEDVTNYEHGTVTDHEGTWHAGEDGPPGMIMPGTPEEGDAWRPENIPGLVLEEVTVEAADVTVDGPRGPVAGALRVRELLMDGTTEHKVFAPGYGEFQARAEDELATVAIGIPTDALSATLPAQLSLLAGALADFEVRTDGSIAPPASDLEDLWTAAPAAELPPLLKDQMDAAFDAYRAAAAAQDAHAAREALFDVSAAALDLSLPYLPLAQVDADRLAIRARRLLADAETRDAAAAASDATILETIWQRLGPDQVARAVDVGALVAMIRRDVDAADWTALARDAEALFQTPTASTP